MVCSLANPLSRRFVEALDMACELHRGQARKGSQTTYVAHLLGVTSLALENGASEDEAIAALLHDAVEDQGGMATAELIRNRFGTEVAEIVLACSDSTESPRPPWRDRKLGYLAKLRSASASAKLVSLCDKLHNARSLVIDYRAHGEAIWKRFNGGREGTLWYFRELVLIFEECGPAPLAHELSNTLAEIETLVRDPDATRATPQDPEEAPP